MLNATYVIDKAADEADDSLVRRMRDEIRSPASRRVFDVLVGSVESELAADVVVARAKLPTARNLGPAVRGILCAARRVGVDPLRVYETEGRASSLVMRSALAVAKTTKSEPAATGDEATDSVAEAVQAAGVNGMTCVGCAKATGVSEYVARASLAYLETLGFVRRTERTVSATPSGMAKRGGGRRAQVWAWSGATAPRAASKSSAAAEPVAAEPQSARLTSLEAAVLPKLGDVPAPAETLAAKAKLTRGDTRIALSGLAAKGLAAMKGGCGWALSTSTSPGGKRPGDVVEKGFAILVGDAEERLGVLGDESVDMIATSSPYWHERDYGVAGQIGWERTPDAFVSRIVGVLKECGRVLRKHGLIFFNFDDHVSAGKLACLDAKIMTKLDAAGLEKFREIVWHKPNPQPCGTDNAPSHSYEKVFILRKKGAKHYWDAYAAREVAKGGGMKRIGDVWEVPVGGGGAHSNGAHYAAFPAEIVEKCLAVGTSEKGYCVTCGSPWVRVLERGQSTWKAVGATARRAASVRAKTGKADDNNARDAAGRNVAKKMADMRHTGWKPTCHCGAQVVKAVVADPFCGSGTTGIVSVARGCEFFGVDLNPQYVKDAAAAIRKARP